MVFRKVREKSNPSEIPKKPLDTSVNIPYKNRDMKNEPTNITLPEPPAGHVWQYRGKVEGYIDLPFTKTVIYSDLPHYWEAVAVKVGDKVRSKKTGKIYTIVDIDLCKIEDEDLQVWSADLEHLELVVESREQLEKELLMESVQFGGIATYEDEISPEKLHKDVAFWKDLAAQSERNADYYRNLLIQCGQAIGKEAYTCDDGTTQVDVLVAKVPELVRAAFAPTTVANEPEGGKYDGGAKWIRDFAERKLRDLQDEIDHTEGGKTWPGTVSLKGMMQSVANELSQEDYTQQAKDILQEMHGYRGNIRANGIDNFVDLIIKAAKQH